MTGTSPAASDIFLGTMSVISPTTQTWPTFLSQKTILISRCLIMLQLPDASSATHHDWRQCAVNSTAMTRAVQSNEPVIMWLTQTHKSLLLLHQLSRIWLQWSICFFCKISRVSKCWHNIVFSLLLSISIAMYFYWEEKQNILSMGNNDGSPMCGLPGPLTWDDYRICKSLPLWNETKLDTRQRCSLH